jgi:hypothetical protein
MAIRYAVANGNWSNTATWDGGTLPTTGDEVFSNNFRVTIDVPLIDALYLTNGSNVSPAINAGGGFTTSVNCTILSNINWRNATNVVANKLLIVSGNTTTDLSGTINGGTGTSATTAPIVEVLSGTTLNYSGGEIINTTTVAAPLIFYFVDCYGTANINANVTSFSGNGSTNYLMFLRDGGNMTINGNITQRNTNSNGQIVIQNANTILSINGNINVNTAVPLTVINTLSTTKDTIFNFFGNIVFTAVVNFGFSHNGALNERFISNITIGTITRIGNQNINFSQSRGTLNLVGNFQHNDNFGGSLLLSTSTQAFGFISTNVTYNIIGNFKGSPLNPSLLGISSPSLLIDTSGVNCVFNIIGNVEGGDGWTTDDRFRNSGIINVNSTATIQGEIIAIASSFPRNPGILSYNSSNVFIKRAITGAAPNYTAPYQGTVRFINDNPEIVVSKQDNTTITLIDPSLQDYPSENDVREGVEYGFMSYEGTLSVPLPSQVSLGTPTDNTVGTGIVTSNDFLEAIKTSSDPLAERLRNVATVQTVGDQFNSFS